MKKKNHRVKSRFTFRQHEIKLPVKKKKKRRKKTTLEKQTAVFIHSFRGDSRAQKAKRSSKEHVLEKPLHRGGAPTKNPRLYLVRFNSADNKQKAAKTDQMHVITACWVKKSGVRGKHLCKWRSSVEVGVKQSHLLHDIEEQILQRKARAGRGLKSRDWE